MRYNNERLGSRPGFIEFDSEVLSGPVLLVDQYWKTDATYELMVCTTKDVYKYDFNNSRYDYLTPKYDTGLIKVTNGSKTIHGGIQINACEAVWDDGSGGDVTPEADSTDYQDGTKSCKLTVSAGAGVELLAYENFPAVDLSSADSIGFWFKTDTDLSAGDLKIYLDDTTGCASPIETLDIPAITSAEGWKWMNIAFADPSLLTAIVSVGIYQVVDKGAMVIHIDQIVGGDWVDQIKSGDYLGVGSNYHTGSTFNEIDAVVSDTEITLTTAYVGSTASFQPYMVRNTFTGSETNLWSRTEFLDDVLGEIWIASNGVDKPVYYTGSGQVVDLTMPTGVTAAKYIISYYDRLVISWTVEGGANQPTRLRWSAVANANSWNDLHVIDLVQPDFTWWIQGMILFGDYLVIPKEAGAYIARPVATDDIFDFEFASHFFGNFAPFSLIPIGNKIYYMGYENRFRVATLTGDDPIFHAVAPYTRAVDPTLAEHTYGYQLEYHDEIRWFLPFDSDNNIQPVVVYNYLHEVTQIWEYITTSGFACVGEYLNQADLYVDDATWGEYYLDEQEGYWDDRSLLASAPVILYGGRDGVVYTADIGNTDDGSSFTRKFVTSRIDFEMPHKKKRLFRQEWWLDASTAGSVTVKLKKDDNVSFEAGSKSISLTDSSRDVIKKKLTWDKQLNTAQMEVSSTLPFDLHGFMNWIAEKGKDNA